MPNQTVLIVSSKDDLHALAVSDILKKRFAHDSVIVDMSQYPASGCMTARIAPEGVIGGSMSNPIDIELDDIVSVWWRRPQPFVPPDAVSDPRLRHFAVQECRTTFEGMLLARNVRFVNNRLAEYAANHKLCQLESAKRAGFRIPDTLITNDPAVALDFIEKRGSNVVFKAQGDARYHMGETRLLKPEHLAKLDLVSIAPVIFQEYIPAEYDIRLTVAGSQQFPVRISTNEGRSPVDWRLDLMTPMKVAILPDGVEEKTRELMQLLGLDFGAIDLRITPSGEAVFFEVNPAGQFLFCELEGRLQITEALAHVLISAGA